MVGESDASPPHAFLCVLGLPTGKGTDLGKFFSALLGVIAGFILAHVANQTPEGRLAFARIRATVGSFLDGFRSGYRGPENN